MRWIEALKIWNGRKGGPWCVPRKGSAEHAEVKVIMAGEGTKLKAEPAAKPAMEAKKFKPRISEEVKKKIEERKVESKKEKVMGFLKRAIQKKQAKKAAEKPKNEMIMPKKEETRRQEVGEVGRVKALVALLKKSDDLEKGFTTLEEKGKYLYSLTHENDGSKSIEKRMYGSDLRSNRQHEPFDAAELRFLKKLKYKVVSSRPHRVEQHTLETLKPQLPLGDVKSVEAMKVEEPNKEHRIKELQNKIASLKRKLQTETDREQKRDLQDELEKAQTALQLYNPKNIGGAVLEQAINTIRNEYDLESYADLTNKVETLTVGDYTYRIERRIKKTSEQDYGRTITRYNVTWIITKTVVKEMKLKKTTTSSRPSAFTAAEQRIIDTMPRNSISYEKSGSIAVIEHHRYR